MTVHPATVKNNSILHDHNSLNCFEENDVAIPITVLEELDNFKRGIEIVHGIRIGSLTGTGTSSLLSFSSDDVIISLART